MNRILEQLQEIWRAVSGVRASYFHFQDLLDIALLTFIIYKGIQMVRETRGYQLLKGIAILAAAYGVALLFDLIAIKLIMERVFGYGVIALVVVFQPELRRVLEQTGRSRIGNLGFGPSQQEMETERLLKNIDSVCRACGHMQDSKTGAIIVIERQTMISELLRTGTVLDADISSDLICSIFYPDSPLHDGAIIIRGGRILAASCILPLTQSETLSRELGTRHRAALGISEISDAVAVVVSEETGTISVAVNGDLTREFNLASLHSVLQYELMQKDAQPVRKKWFWKKG